MNCPRNKLFQEEGADTGGINSMVGSGHVDKGAIYSAAGDSVWATSAGFEVRLPFFSICIWGLTLG